MGSAEAMERVISIVQKPQKDARIAAVVVSAMSGVTDELIAIATLASQKDLSYEKRLDALERRHIETVDTLMRSKNREKAREVVESTCGYLREAVQGIRLTRDLSPQILDYVMSYGERLSAHVLTEALNDRGVKSEYLNARRVVRTDAAYGAANVDFKTTNKQIRDYFKKHRALQVVTGFIGSTSEGKTTTLGRGGSDYSGSIVGGALGASVIEIWTDVSGVYTADPRLVKNAKVVPELAFEEAGELAYFGAKVLHPKMLLPAMREHVPVKVLNTFEPDASGTLIVANFAERKHRSHSVEALSFKRSVTLIHVQSPEFFDSNGLIAGIFRIFDTHQTSIDLIATSVAGVSLTIDNERHLKSIVRDLKVFGEISIERGRAIICAVGGSVNAAGVAGGMFKKLGKAGIGVELISQAASGVSITFVVLEKDAEKALKILHKEYIS
jgi:aspartate kinase